MAQFDVSFLNPKMRTSSGDYGFLVDQLDIKRNQLESDGKLSPGDYDILSREAQKIYSHPGLTPAQRSNVLVKISQYKQEKSTSGLKDSNDLARLNREIKDDMAKNAMLFGNNPAVLLKANSDALRLKIDSLSQSIDALNNAGDDPSSHLNEYNDTLNAYNDSLQALDDVKNHKSGEKPTSNYVAYLTTNSSGEITDVSIGKTGSKTGYAETNGLYGGLQIYGKVNRKEFGKNIFQLGSNTFQGSDLTIQDPTTPGAFRSAPLVSQKTSQGRNLGVIPDQYDEVDLTQVRPQSSIRTGGWAEGEKGFLYQRLDDGSYKKYVNADKAQLGISENDIIKLPRVMEKGILPSVKETIDGSKPFTAPISPAAAPTPTAPAPQAQAPAQQQPGGTSRTPSPTQRAPSTGPGIAEKVLNAGKGILNYLFSGGQ